MELVAAHAGRTDDRGVQRVRSEVEALVDMEGDAAIGLRQLEGDAARRTEQDLVVVVAVGAVDVTRTVVPRVAGSALDDRRRDALGRQLSTQLHVGHVS
jgi:hypothetical protein